VVVPRRHSSRATSTSATIPSFRRPLAVWTLAGPADRLPPPSAPRETAIATDTDNATPRHRAQREGDDGTTPGEIAVGGIHDRAIELLEHSGRVPAETGVADIGAGMGALSRRLADAGYAVRACDLFPEFFRVPEVECLPVGEDGRLPYQDASLDVAFGVELVEHMENPGRFFKEAARVLKSGGELILTTPNILSLKSRLAFLLTGYTYSFPPLDPDVRDPVRQHITPLTLDGYRWRLKQAGFDIVEVAVDKYQNTSLWLSFLLPLVWFASFRSSKSSTNVWPQNQFRTLYGRTLMIRARRS